MDCAKKLHQTQKNISISHTTNVGLTVFIYKTENPI